jgi:predicted Zn-dependent peptidase
MITSEEFSIGHSRLLTELHNSIDPSSDYILELIIEAASNDDEQLEHLYGFKERMQKINRRKLREIANKYFTNGYAHVLMKPA